MNAHATQHLTPLNCMDYFGLPKPRRKKLLSQIAEVSYIYLFYGRKDIVKVKKIYYDDKGVHFFIDIRLKNWTHAYYRFANKGDVLSHTLFKIKQDLHSLLLDTK